MARRITILIALAIAGIAAGAALAGTAHHHGPYCHFDGAKWELNTHPNAYYRHLGVPVKECSEVTEPTTTGDTTTGDTTTGETTTGDTTTTETTTTETVPVVIDTSPSRTYLCWSAAFVGSFPIPVNVADAAADLAKGWTVPYAVPQAEANKQNLAAQNPVGDHVLACNADGLKPTGAGYNGSGGSVDRMSIDTWSDYLKAVTFGDASPANHYPEVG